MKKITLERAGLNVSNMCLGTMLYGTSVSKEEAFRQLDLYVSMGGNFLDTSNNYAHWMPNATGDESETLLGEWLKNHGRREDLVIATKVGYDRHGEGAGLTAKQIEYWCDESLRKLNTDYIDLYYAHVDDMNTPIEETMEVFDRLVKKGKVKALGASNFYTYRMEQAKNICEKNGFAQYTVNQPCFTYLNAREGWGNPYPLNVNAGEERLAYLKENNIPLVAYSCLAGGGYDNDSRLPEKYFKGKRLELIRKTAKELSLTPTELVLVWLINLHKIDTMPQVIPLFSASNCDKLKRNLELSDYELDNSILRMLTEALD